MGKHTGVLLLTVLLLAVFNSAVAQIKPSYFVVGRELKLELSPPVSTSITNILWKYDVNLLAEWVKGAVELTYYGRFKGRTTLQLRTGNLEIRNTSTEDIGLYTVEINNQVLSPRYDAKAIEEVPQPEVWLRPVACSLDNRNCTLTCGGETEKAEPVTYSWKEEGRELKESGKDLKIFKDQTAHVKSYTCMMENPVSEKRSAPKNNPFFQEEKPDTALRVGLGVGIPLVLLAVGLAIWKRASIINMISQFQGGNNAGSTAENGRSCPPSENPPEIVGLKSPEPETQP